jgi:hypothetical protein
MVREPRVPGCKVAHPSPCPIPMVKKFVAGNKGLMG